MVQTSNVMTDVLEPSCNGTGAPDELLQVSKFFAGYCACFVAETA